MGPAAPLPDGERSTTRRTAGEHPGAIPKRDSGSGSPGGRVVRGYAHADRGLASTGIVLSVLHNVRVVPGHQRQRGRRRALHPGVTLAQLTMGNGSYVPA
jgi:hypothetical protein